MSSPHAHHVHSAAPTMTLLIVAMLLAAAAYVGLVVRLRRRGRRWSVRRTISFLAGAGLVLVALNPEVLPYANGDFRQHMLQHLLIAMLAPVLLVMAAPVTLLLRSMTAKAGRKFIRLLHGPPILFISHPAIALFLNLGGMAALYFTPLYALSHQSPLLHLLIHVHFLAAGCLFTWIIVGPDPVPHRTSVPARLVVLGVAIFVHASLSQLLYAGWNVAVAAPVLEIRGGAELMYYGGDITELVLAFALVSGWRPRRRGANRLQSSH